MEGIGTGGGGGGGGEGGGGFSNLKDGSGTVKPRSFNISSDIGKLIQHATGHDS